MALAPDLNREDQRKERRRGVSLVEELILSFGLSYNDVSIQLHKSHNFTSWESVKETNFTKLDI